MDVDGQHIVAKPCKYIQYWRISGKMVPRQNFMLLVCLMMAIVFSSGKPPNSSTKPVAAPKSQAGQSFVINNNCGLPHIDREIIAHIKAKVDYIAAQASKGMYR